MIKYMTEQSSTPKIIKVEVTKETKHFIYKGTERHAKISSWCSYFDTYRDAYLYLLNQAHNDYKKRCIRARYALNKLEEVIALADIEREV